tara:strand:+ start:2801 stop:2962 length:162 start_codon:yes stop_codon:yes gene_type:complete
MEKTRMIHIRLNESMRKEIKLLCVHEDKTIQDYIVDLIQKDFGKRKKKGGAKK